MNTPTMKLYHATGSPNSRRVRMFLAEKELVVPLVSIDLGKGEQHSESYRAINPRRVVPTLVLADGTAIGEVPAICRYIEAVQPQPNLFGQSALEIASITMWERRAELEGFAAVMEAVRNAAPGLVGRAIAGPHDYEQIPALAERSKLRIEYFLSDLETRLSAVPFVAGERFSVADITALVTVDFAARASAISIPAESRSLKRWYQTVSSRPSSTA
ncbi:MAG: glutathione S-transferase [Gammaproteobacteria bacterium]